MYVCLSERLVHSALAPPLPPNKPLLLPSHILAGEALVQCIFHDKRGVATKTIKSTALNMGADKEQYVDAVEATGE